MIKQVNQQLVATRLAYGENLVKLGKKYPKLVVLEAGLSNSTYSELFAQKFPKRFFPMFIAEQNLVGVAVGLAIRSYIPFISTFAAFWTRAFDQLRMASYSQANLKICGSHSGLSAGPDGISQMGLEDLAMFRLLYGSIILCPADDVSTAKLMELAYKTKGMVYLRTSKIPGPSIYHSQTEFIIGGLQVLRKSEQDKVAIITNGILLHEALVAFEKLRRQGIKVRIIDLYCLKPLSFEKLTTALKGIKKILTVEDHYPEGGLGEAIIQILKSEKYQIENLAVYKLPKSGSPTELLSYEKIDQTAIINKIKSLL